MKIGKNMQKIRETAAAGATGGGSIAVRTDGGSKNSERMSFTKFLADFNLRVKNRFTGMKSVTPFALKEGFDLQDVLSRLSGLEGNKHDQTSNTTYGVEDEKGNIMKITVRATQAAEFEAALAAELADIESYKAAGTRDGKTNKISMAELLFNLKDKFEIVDVAFPQIPTDVVYNADDASTNIPASNPMKGEIGDDMGDDDDLDPPFSGKSKLDINDMDDGEEDGEEDSEFDDEGDDEFDIEGDDESVEDFGDDDEVEDDTSEGSILKSVIAMLKSQADAEKAKAEAEGEKHRAMQAEYTARAASSEMRNQEEVMRMEAGLDAQKKREKEAKKMADLAKYKVSKAGNFSESTSLREADEFETESMLRRQRTIVAQKYAAAPGDNPETIKYKSIQKQLGMREIDNKIRQARARSKFRTSQYDQIEQENEKQRQQQPQQRPGNPNQQAQQTNASLPATARTGMGY